MKRLIVLPVAERDLLEIWNYSFANWGPEQADRYLGDLVAMFDRIASGAAPSRRAENLQTGLRKVPIGRHVVYFRDVGEVVEVVRVLHERMDVGQL